MAIKETLDKIVERHKDLVGAMVISDGHVHHNLEAPYDVVSVELILETLTEIFETTEMLADEGHDFGEVMIDFSNHSLIARSIDNGVLAVLAPRLQRGQLVKLHVGLGVFAKAVQKALAETEVAVAPEQEPAEPVQPAAAVPQAVKPPTAEELAAADTEAKERELEAEQGEHLLGRAFKRKRSSFRGSKPLSASPIMAAPAAEKAEVAPEASAEKEMSEDGVPLNADGTPKKKKMYRGQVYYE